MEKQQKLYVFNRNEVLLLFAFLILIAITSFVLGVKIGKNYSYSQAGLTQDDQVNIELKSNQEEAVNKVVQKANELEQNRDQTLDATYEKLKHEFDQLKEKKDLPQKDIVEQHRQKEEVQEVSGDQNTQEDQVTSGQIEDMSSAQTTMSAKRGDEYTGKYSIQLGSHRSVDDAEKFADGFRVRGYDPVIINEVELKGRGTWYRVSLGVFDSFQDAKAFFLKEQSLFKGLDEPLIVKFK